MHVTLHDMAMAYIVLISDSCSGYLHNYAVFTRYWKSDMLETGMSNLELPRLAMQIKYLATWDIGKHWHESHKGFLGKVFPSMRKKL